LSLNAGPSNAKRNYCILGTASGTEPGFPLPGGLTTLPLNWDSFTSLVWKNLNNTVFSNFKNVLDSEGKAVAALNAPPCPGFAGRVLHFAYCLYTPFDYVSNPAAIEIVP